MRYLRFNNPFMVRKTIFNHLAKMLTVCSLAISVPTLGQQLEANDIQRYLNDTQLAEAAGYKTLYVVCESHNYQPEVCTLGDLKIVHTNVHKKLSNSSCNNSVWSTTNNQIITTKGCRAVFQVLAKLNVNPVTLQCSSNNYQYRECPVPFQIKGAWLNKRHSKSPCQQEKSWGTRNNILWVNNGCRGTFNLF
ncbi:DUF3011 domain-containing protein [Zooshikella marina]|uniref:DUF3011 domain-containing protein n=1 Tax=Zooshikella ganghwensis TaxID=202772 RepID=UPI001BAFA43A|nr:DUF3011 domain-containing protein [Zooshikella ganghwensis]MBU2705640.1 DUF3011 domain-containing protein [Zooshikella ganghwensis]